MTLSNEGTSDAGLDRPFAEVLSEMRTAFERRGLSAPMGFGERPALLVIDMQSGFTDPDFPLGVEADDTVAAITSLIGEARASKMHIPIVYTTSTWALESDVWARKMPSQREMTPDSKWAELDSRLGRLPDERLVKKHFASAFFGTGLESDLRGMGVDSLVLTGITTSGCVRATAVDGVSHGFKVIVAEEAVADRAEATHVMSLFDLHAKYADVLGVTRIVDHFRSLRD